MISVPVHAGITRITIRLKKSHKTSSPANVTVLRIVTMTALLCLTGLITSSRAQWSMGSRNIAMGQAYTALPDDRWAVFHNPALIDLEKRTLSLFSIRYYGLREIEDHAAVITGPAELPFIGERTTSGVAAAVHSYGFELYRETQIRSGWSVRLQGLHFGISAKYVHIHIKDYSSSGSLLFDAGIAAELTKGLKAGYRMTNLFPYRDNRGEQPLHPVEYAFGFSWKAFAGIVLSADIVKDVLHPFSLRSGLEIEYFDGIFIRGGWTTNPFTWSAGAGFQWSRIRVGIAVQNHEILGLSPGFDCSLTF